MISMVVQPVAVIVVAIVKILKGARLNPLTPTPLFQTKPHQLLSSNPLHHQKALPTFPLDYLVSIAQAIVLPHIDHSICSRLVFRDLD